jgi:FMN phosphatase YigB (HAD superfamily)
LKTVWISRGGADSFAHASDAEPDRELPDLSGLPDVLDELVPA